jgi:hypothetical protein
MTDILLDNSNDLLVDEITQDFSVGDSTVQEVESIVLSYPGWWKEYPLVGCAAPNYLNSPGAGQQLSNSINQQLKLDGKTLTSFSASMNADGTLTINVNGQSITVES